MSDSHAPILECMASAAAAAPSQKARSFAGLLEEYAAPAAKFPPARDLDGLEEDVTSLTYEHVLRGRGRYGREPDPIAVLPERQPGRPEAGTTSAQPSLDLRKSASITLRLSADEDTRLRARATEAGMTISAYLRSCAFEVENLRAQVKEAVAQMKMAEEQHTDPNTSWIRRLIPRTRKPA